MINLIPGKKYNLKNIHRTPFFHVVEYVFPQKLSSTNQEIWETFYYRDYKEKSIINRVIVPQRGILSLAGNVLICSNYFPAGGFLPEQEENTQEIKEWLIMIQRIEECNSSKSMCAFAPFKKNFLILN